MSASEYVTAKFYAAQTRTMINRMYEILPRPIADRIINVERSGVGWTLDITLPGVRFAWEIYFLASPHPEAVALLLLQVP